MIHNALASPAFKIFAIPVIFLILGVLSNRVGRRDGDTTPRQNDWAVGTKTLLMTLSKIASDLEGSTSTTNPELIAWLVGIFFFLFISVDHDRFRSWELARTLGTAQQATDKKDIFLGVILPDVVALGLFISYQYEQTRGFTS